VPATLAPADLAAWLEERFPLRGGRVSIELVADDQDRLVYENEKGTLVEATLERPLTAHGVASAR
jgi:hypothetical protein